MSDDALRIIGHVHRSRRARQHHIATVGAERSRPHRRNPERRCIRLAEQFCRLLAARDVVQHPRDKAVFLKRLPVVANRCIALGAACDIAVQKFWQPAPGGRFKIVERKIASQRARNGASGAFYDGRRERDICSLVVHVGERSVN
jgi:hypothetical protein